MQNSKTTMILHKAKAPAGQFHKNGLSVVISPRYYTLKKEQIPVRFAYQAKRLAPSLFDGLLEENKAYEYEVRRTKEGEWQFIAYDPLEISQALEERGVPFKYVKKAVFAQDVIADMPHPIKIDDHDALVSIEGIVSVVPNAMLEDVALLPSVPTEAISKAKAISLHRSAKGWLTSRRVWQIALLSLAASALFVAQGLRYNQGQDTIKELEKLTQEYPSLASRYKREAIVSKYRHIDTKERQKREALNALSGLIFKGVELKGFSLQKGLLQAHLTLSDAKVFEKLKSAAKQGGFLVQKSDSDVLAVTLRKEL